MYDLISINGVSLPDVTAGKGTITVGPNPKYNEYECEDGGKKVDIIEENMIMGSVVYNGLMIDEVSAINSIITLVSTMTIYNPLTGSQKTFQAIITREPLERIIHDDIANAWSFSFEFEEIGGVPT